MNTEFVDHDPVISFRGRRGHTSLPEDTRQNLVEKGECVINIVSGDMVESVNATSLDVPYKISEWVLSGLHLALSSTFKLGCVQEPILSVK